MDHRDPAREAVFVVGMGRSGSSAIARVISLCGAALPLEIVPPNYGNPAGYWEPARAIEINEAFLQANGSSWYDAGFALQISPPAGAPRERLVDEIAQFLESGFGAGPVILKEPRISGLLPYWIQASRACGLTIKFIHIFRNPADVAASLAARDGLPAAQSFALWLKYNVLAERETRGEPRIFVSFEDLMRDWEAVASKCITGLRIDASIDDRTRRSVAAFLAPELYHHRGSASEVAVDPALAARVSRVYELLRAAQSQPVRSAELDTIFADVAG
jgi:hypothetical protein